MGERTGRAPLKMVWFFCCLGFLLTVTLIGAVSGDRFMSALNLRNVMTQFSAPCLMAFGMALTFAAGAPDVSQAGVGALVSVVFATMVNNGAGEGSAVLCALLIGIAVGSLNGLFAALFRRRTMLISFAITAGSMYFCRGIAYWISEGMPLPLKGSANLLNALVSRGYAPTVSLWLCALPLVLFSVTRAGRFLFHASEVGERDQRTGGQRFWACFLSGLFAAVAGIIMTGRIGAGQPTAFSGYEFTLLAIVLGAGVAIPNLGHRKGESAFGLASALIAALSMTIWNNVLNLLGVASYVQMIFAGAIIALFAIVNALFCLALRLPPRPSAPEENPQPYPYAAPAAPVAPTIPVAPAAPVAQVVPTAPVVPVAPTASVAPVAPATPSAASREAEIFAEIGRLYDQFTEGKLSKEEFEERKKELLAGL